MWSSELKPVMHEIDQRAATVLCHALRQHPLLVLRALRAILHSRTRLGDVRMAWVRSQTVRPLFEAYGDAMIALKLHSAWDDRVVAQWVKTHWIPSHWMAL